MAYKVVIGKSAQRDIREALDWYAGESIVALERFLVSLYSRFEDLSEHPESFGFVKQRPRFRKVKLQKFPYYIVFRIDEARSTILVVAVIHVKRNPAVWIRTLR